MQKGTRICKICGKEYPYCKTLRNGDIFRWQDVACSPEHGSEYFMQVLAAREDSILAEIPVSNDSVDTQEEPDYYDEYEDEEDDLFEEDYEDNDE